MSMLGGGKYIIEVFERGAWVFVAHRPALERANEIAQSMQETRGGLYRARRRRSGESLPVRERRRA